MSYELPGEKAPEKKELDVSKLVKARATKIPDPRVEFPEDAPDPIDWQKLGLCFVPIFFLILGIYIVMVYGSNVFNDFTNCRIMTTANSESLFWAKWWTTAVTEPLSHQWVKATFAWDVSSFPNMPAWYHTVNISLHMVACFYAFVFVFLLARRLHHEGRITADPSHLALLSTLVFACHPLASGSVAYMSGRAPILMAANYFAALDLFLFGFFSTNVIVAMLLYGACFLVLSIGLLCSDQIITAPLLMLYIAMMLKAAGAAWRDWILHRWQDFLALVIFALVLAASMFTKTTVIFDNGVGNALLSPLAYVATEAKVLVTYYLRCFILPFGLSIDPPWASANSFADPLAIAGAILFLTAVIALVYLTRSGRYFFPSLGLFIAILGLLPDSFIIQHDTVSDQRFYLSLAGLSLIAGWLMNSIRLPRRAHITVIVIITIALSSLTIWRNTAWLSDKSLWRTSLKLNSHDARALALLANWVFRNSKADAASDLVKRALKIDPESPDANESCGQMFFLAKSYKEAQPYLQHAVDYAKRRHTAMEQLSMYDYYLAQCYMNTEDWQKAKQYALEAMEYRPSYAGLHLALGKAYLGLHQPVMALKELEDGLNRDPYNADFLQPIVEAGLESNVPSMIQRAYMVAKQLNKIAPTRHARYCLVRAAIEMGRSKDALTTLGLGLPKDAEGLWLYSVAQDQLGNHDLSKKCEADALKLDPKIKERVPVKIVDVKKYEKEAQLGAQEQAAEKRKKQADDRP